MKHSHKILPLLLLFQISAIKTVSALDYVDLDFETPAKGLLPVSGKAYPLWTLPPAFDENYGAGNQLEISKTSSHSGSYSLRFNYEAKNNFCNTCGTKLVVQKKGVDGVNYVIASSGEDLTRESYPDGTPAPHASLGKHVYNTSRGYSQWEITSISNDSATNDKLSLKLLHSGVGEFADKEQIINTNDKLAVARRCGVDGIIGKSNGEFMVNRRSDCNSSITWFGNIGHINTADAIQPPGGSLFRRAYLKAELVDPPTGQKLNYARFMRVSKQTDNAIADKFVEVVLVADFSLRENLEPHASGFGKIGGLGRYKPGQGMPVNLQFERGKWYYIEEEYKAETYTIKTTLESDGNITVNSYKGNSNGEYRLWFAESGKESAVPLINIKNLSLPPIIGGKGTHVSLWGNEGHDTHSRGSWYIDDVKISNKGPIGKKPGDDGFNLGTPQRPGT